jgi:hypothetical protein
VADDHIRSQRARSFDCVLPAIDGCGFVPESAQDECKGIRDDLFVVDDQYAGHKTSVPRPAEQKALKLRAPVATLPDGDVVGLLYCAWRFRANLRSRHLARCSLTQFAQGLLDHSQTACCRRLALARLNKPYRLLLKLKRVTSPP